MFINTENPKKYNFSFISLIQQIHVFHSNVAQYFENVYNDCLSARYRIPKKYCNIQKKIELKNK